MPEVIFNGPEGRLEGRYHQNTTQPDAPTALILHPHPRYGGTMNNKVVYTLFHTFVRQGFSVLRFNFRGVGRSQGRFDNGQGELADAAAALDWMQATLPDSHTTWVAGYSFGAWIGMQLLMRRPEIRGFVSVSPPANIADFSFLAPCPASGLIIQGDADETVPEADVAKLVQKLSQQRAIEVRYRVVKGATHFFENDLETIGKLVQEYLLEKMAAKTAADVR
jgi:alpha/beta superfamily hydrolase